MHLRVSTVRRGNRTYRYAQLVESYRRPDGMPAQRVLAHLGPRTPQEMDNLRLALSASRAGRSVVLADEERERSAAQPVLANLAYLDVAVALEMWRHWRLDELLTAVMPDSEHEVSDASVVAALTIQRCVAPGSKLYAQRWYPRTALPELLAIPPAQFNNTRIHRVLDLLDQGTAELQKRLPERYAAREGAFTALFLDVTDTWFVGHGPGLAESGKTKEGRYERKVGIVLMCNESGLPLRWEVIPGRRHDSQAMLGVLDSVRALQWLGQAPVVCDRAMGKTAHLKKLLASGVRFLTALTEDEVDAYTDGVPHAAVADIETYAESAANRAALAVEQAGMTRLKDGRHVLDLGVVERRDDAPTAPAGQPPAAASGEDPVRHAFGQVMQMRAALEEGRARDFRDAGRAHGLKKERVSKLMRLLRLAPDLQEGIQAGRAATLALNAVLAIAGLPDPQAQREAFDEKLRAVHTSPMRRRASANRDEMSRRTEASRESPVRLRAVVCFNAEQFVEQRRAADEKLAESHAFVRELNERLASPRARRSKESAYAEVDRELRRREILNAFEIIVHEHPRDGGATRLEVELRLVLDAWRKRRRYDGFTVLVAHPETLQEAAELNRLYGAKDQVERDFHVIKSVVQLRPVRHRTIPKVRAHVTLCMLALLLDRTLERKLSATAAAMSASMARELLGSVHLNQLADIDAPVYTVTRPDQDQRALLQALELESLVNDQEVADRITAR
jgi:hypothetical protein